MKQQRALSITGGKLVTRNGLRAGGVRCVDGMIVAVGEITPHDGDELVDAKGLNSATSEMTTAFDVSMPALTKLIGSAGDGSTANKPLKLVLLLTDGVQSKRDWVVDNPSNTWDCVSTVSGNCIKFNTTYFPDSDLVRPLGPSLCKEMKTNNVTVGVLYTEYLSIPLDWGYNGTVGDSM